MVLVHTVLYNIIRISLRQQHTDSTYIHISLSSSFIVHSPHTVLRMYMFRVEFCVCKCITSTKTNSKYTVAKTLLLSVAKYVSCVAIDRAPKIE
jgi:hypothetical protein